ncbi:MAG: methyltransferase domain-containing protein [Fimbriimonadales bacterium]|nr:methyltransferase domain-containing protein [Fimbriimonadales bacterium]
MRDFARASQQVAALFEQAARPENRARYDAELWQYYPQLRTPQGCAQETRYVYDLCRLARFDPEGKRVLDAGCGFGLQLIVLHLMGAREVIGFDPSENRLRTCQQLIADFGLQGVGAQLAALETVDYEPASFDMILSNEAISHYPDVDEFLERAARWLRRGGVLIIADGNNGANPQLAAHTRQIWQRFENGPAGEFHGHRILKPYVEQRAELIQQAFPDLPAETAQTLAQRTSLLTRPAILQAVERYLKTGELPNSVYDPTQCPVNPYSGAVIERLFHPLELAHHIDRFGFRARAYAYFGGAGGNPLVRFANAVLMRLTPLTLRWAKSFRVVAVRL